MTEFGHDDDRTVMMQPKQVEALTEKRSPWLWVGVVGCAGLLCLVLVGGVAAFFALGGGERIAQATATATQKATEVATPTKAATKTVEPTKTPTKVAVKPTATPTLEPTETPTSTPPPSEEPTIGSITFATGVTSGKPVGAASSFPADVTEIHALFDYKGWTDGDSWERRWYQNGEDVGGGSGAWEGGESGTYDVSLSNNGKPLGSGDWKLEIYVRGKLIQTGTFVIQAAATATPTKRPSGGGTYKIAFARWDGGKHNLYIADTSGGGEQFLLERAGAPSWSPDGQYLSIYGGQGVDRQMRDGKEYVVSGITNGILLLKVANFPSDITKVEILQVQREGTARSTAWSPDGNMIAWDAKPVGDYRIFFRGARGTQLEAQSAIEIPGEQPDWSPNSAQIAYRSGRDNKQGIWISNRDDSGAHNITNEGNDAFPRWSPDGKKIAFHREAEGNVDIYVMNVDGSNIRRLTDANGPDTLPAWTPDGRIVFRSARTGSWGIYIMNADGSNQKQIIANADPGPDWAFGRMDVH